MKEKEITFESWIVLPNKEFVKIRVVENQDIEVWTGSTWMFLKIVDSKLPLPITN